ncbi:hypothetical protein [Streptomyces sp. NBC_00847]|uniref:hypothetical protein n=1 Tax=unclassified Streptomyces TaxID=2593676 RepID=UPI00225AF724|nr:hypothetical protein [Streptomyces sp. NBC_00847]MCX4878145.1 hypothetical protein [Streptomyces sp. NBC_00847]
MPKRPAREGSLESGSSWALDLCCLAAQLAQLSDRGIAFGFLLRPLRLPAPAARPTAQPCATAGCAVYWSVPDRR